MGKATGGREPWFLSQQRKAHRVPFFGYCHRNHGAHTLGHRTVMPLAWNARWLVIPINQLLAPACLQSEELATPRSLSCAALGFLPLLF